MVRTQLLVVLAIATIALAPPASANIVVNGGFEAPALMPGAFQLVTAGQSDLAPWVVTQTQVDLVHQDLFPLGPAAEGVQYLDLDGTPGPGGIYQDLTTTPGATYSLTFDYANHTDPATAPWQATVDVLNGAVSLLGGPVPISHITSIPGALNWTPFSTSFVAGGAVTRLTFNSIPPIHGGDHFGGILLDNISVAIPEASAVLCCGLIAGVVGVGTVMRRWWARTNS